MVDLSCFAQCLALREAQKRTAELTSNPCVKDLTGQASQKPGAEDPARDQVPFPRGMWLWARRCLCLNSHVSLLAHRHFWSRTLIGFSSAEPGAKPLLSGLPLSLNQVLSSVGSLGGGCLGDVCSCNSSWPFKEGRKQLSGLGIASAGAWRVPGEGGAGWWLISLVPCENSHPRLPAPGLQPPPPGSSSPSPTASP